MLMPTLELSEERFREIGHQVIDLMAEILAAETMDPVRPPMSGKDVRATLDEPLPRESSTAEAVFTRLRENLLPYMRKNGHPRFFAYVCASVDPLGTLADALASTLNQNLTAWRSSPGATEIEHLVVRWLDEMVGFSGGGQGLLVSGGSAANTHALACAIARAEEHTPDRRRMTLYLSRECHMSCARAARYLGLADAHVRHLSVDCARRMRPTDLARQLNEDRASGLVPVAVVASAGTANTGAIDPLIEIAEICRNHGFHHKPGFHKPGFHKPGFQINSVWFHIDGAYGAPAALTEDYAWMRDAFAAADSLSLDPHKWLFAPLDVACVLLRDQTSSRRMFSQMGEYVTVDQTDWIERYAFFDHGLELSRRFRALKVWMILKARGVDTITSIVERNIRLRRELDERVEAEPRLQTLGSDLSISCFRFVPEGFSDDDELSDGESLNELNQKILETLNAEGSVFMSPTTLDGRYALRVAIVNFRTSSADIDFLVEAVLRVGAAILAES